MCVCNWRTVLSFLVSHAANAPDKMSACTCRVSGTFTKPVEPLAAAPGDAERWNVGSSLAN